MTSPMRWALRASPISASADRMCSSWAKEEQNRTAFLLLNRKHISKSMYLIQGMNSSLTEVFSGKCTFGKAGQAAALARTRLAQNTGLECELRDWRWGGFHCLLEQVLQSHHHVSQSVVVQRRHFRLPSFLRPRPLTYHVLGHTGQRSDQTGPESRVK